MLPSDYQKAAARTECSEDNALMRMRCGVGPFGLENDSPSLLPIRLTHAMIGMLTEVGEFATTLKKHIYYGKPLDRENLVTELGDSLWYIALACNALEVDLGEVMAANIRKLKARYPEKFTESLAAEENRDLAAEKEALGVGTGYRPVFPISTKTGAME